MMCPKCGGVLIRGYVSGKSELEYACQVCGVMGLRVVSQPAQKPASATDTASYLPGLFLDHWPKDAPQPTPEYKFAPGRKCAFDLAWPAKKVAVECEGYVHKTEGRFHSDVEKYNLAVMMGWRIYRATRRILADQGEAFANVVRMAVEE